MTLIFVLFAIGIFLLALEVIVPGGILGIVGGLSLLGGVLVAFDRFGPGGGAWALAAGVLVTAIALYLEFVLLPRSRLAKALSLTATVEGRSQPPVADASLTGRTGVAVTTLAPTGIVECEGRRYEAFSRSGLIAAGAPVEVTAVETFRILVIPAQTTTSSS
ncbi:MAG: NfeD family protein [Verrucomicrobiota bacterium]